MQIRPYTAPPLTARHQLNRPGPRRLPDRLPHVPLGSESGRWWASSDTSTWQSSFGDAARKLLLPVARAFGSGLGQIALTAWLPFALFRDAIVSANDSRRSRAVSADPGAREPLHTVHRTVVGVMAGVLGATLAQALMAIAGFVTSRRRWQWRRRWPARTVPAALGWASA